MPDGSVKQIDVPYEIPESWEWGRLSSVVTLINGDRGKNYPSKDKLFSEGDIPFVNAGNINNNLIIQDNLLYLSQSQYDALGSGKLQYGDIVYCIRGSLGKNGLFTMPKGAIASSLIILRIIGDKSLNTDYFLSYLNSELCKNEILKFDNGTAQPNLSGQNLSKFLIPIPPFEEQLRISSMIKKALVLVNKYTTRYQMLNTLNRTFPEKLRKSILQYAIQGNLVPQDATDEPVEVLLEKIREEKQKLFAEGKLQKKDLQESIIYEGDDSSYKHIPKSWVLTTLGNVGFWRSGATPSRSNPLYFGGDIPWLKTGDLNDGYIYHIPENITALALKETSVKLIPSDSVLIAMYGATIGKIGILTFPATTNQACCACTPYNILNNQYLFWYLRFSRDKFIEMAEGGAQPNISKEKIVGFPIALPPIREQRKIVNKIECLIDKVSLL